MPEVIISGSQWGDEGKGKAVDALHGDVNVRFQGGANSGHTLVINGEKQVLHLIPCGIMHGGSLNLVGPSVLCDLDVLTGELKVAEKAGSIVKIDRSAPIVLNIQKQIDQGREKVEGSGAIGTTGRGIGPAMQHFVSRRAIKMGDLTKEEKIRQAVKDSMYGELCATADHYGIHDYQSEEALVEWLMGYGDIFRKHLDDTRRIVWDARNAGKSIIFEGAQALLLDPLQGGPPYTTASFCTPAFAWANFGGADRCDDVIGIMKAYLTRVGGGSFPTELDNEIGEELRKRGDEYGATTRRPRRCGWLDLVLLRYAVRMGGFTKLILTKLDILTGMKEIKVAVGYKFKGKPLAPNESITSRVLRDCEVEYVTLEGWDKDLTGLTWHEFPQAARTYVCFIENFVGIEIAMVGTGAGREHLVRVAA